ncbi:hypothetical protein DRQ09_08865, partial [candidate division KSB1 bacterium]
MSKRYRKPPIIEALCEFQFISKNRWDLTVPGLIYEKVRTKFPDKKERQGLDFIFKTTKKGILHKVEPSPPRIQFYKKDRTALIQIAKDLLVINQLKPYPSWSKFKQLII